MADVAADRAIEALRLSSFVIMRGAPAPNVQAVPRALAAAVLMPS